MHIPTKSEINQIKIKYPEGTRIRLIAMKQEQYPVPSGTIGTVTGVDDIGTIHMTWDNHSSLGLAIGIDEFEIIETGKEE